MPPPLSQVAAFEAVKHVRLPSTTACGPRVRAVQECYRRATNRTLCCESAIAYLDRIMAERGEAWPPHAGSDAAEFGRRPGSYACGCGTCAGTRGEPTEKESSS